MKNIFLIFLFFLFWLSSYGQVDSVIYGLARKVTPAEIYLAKINPSTGVVTNISNLSLATTFTLGSSTIDPINKIYYFNTNGTFVGVNMTTGNIVSNPTITNSNGTYFDEFLFNCSDSTIYGLARKVTPAEVYLAKINPSTGVVTNISNSSLATTFTLTGSTIDPINKIYYFITNGTFVGVNMTTGNIVSNPTITNSNGTYFDVFLFNSSDSTIYGLARKVTPAEIYLAKINPSTGVVTNISNSSLATTFTLTGSAIDPINKIYYFITNGTFLGVNMITGNIVSNPTITNSNGIYFDAFRYSGICDNVRNSVTISINSGTDKVFVFPNPFSFETNLQTNRSLEDATLTVYNSFGQPVKQINNISRQTITFFRENLKCGLYFFRLTEENKTIAVNKIIIIDK